MRKYIDLYRNERGNMILFILGMISIMMVLFILVINLSSALATRQQADTVVSQASLAATSAFYEEVWTTVTGFSYPEPIPPTPPDEDAGPEAWAAYEEAYEEYLEKKEVYEFFHFFHLNLAGIRDGLTGPFYSDWSDNEKNLEALDILLTGGLSNGRLLQEILEGLLRGNSTIQNSTIHMAIQTIEQNGGVLEEATLDIDGDRIVIRAATEATSSSYENILQSVTKKMFKESAGPKIEFIDLIWTEPTPVFLEYE